jgi:hypothetical protein
MANIKWVTILFMVQDTFIGATMQNQFNRALTANDPNLYPKRYWLGQHLN